MISPLPESNRGGFSSIIRSVADSLMSMPRKVKEFFSPDILSPVSTQQPNVRATFNRPDSTSTVVPTSIPTSTPIPTPIPTSTPTPTPIQSNLARNPAISNFNIQPEVIDAITQAAQKYGLPPKILFDIALQESSFDPRKVNPETGVHHGLFQFDPPTWQTAQNYANMPSSSLTLPENPNRFDPFINALVAAYFISHGQLGRWDASKDVWGPFYSEEELTPYYSQTLSRKGR